MRPRRVVSGITFVIVAIAALACQRSYSPQEITGQLRPLPSNSSPSLRRVVEAANEQPGRTVSYDQSYERINYPGGDVPVEKGACTDVVVRAFRGAGVDLQSEIHEDMSRNFAAYPTKWGLTRPDPNIDHRRVPNLRTFFARRNKGLPATEARADYLPGDVVTWDLGNRLDHIGIVTNYWSESTGRYMVVHNIGRGAQVEDVLFAWTITGHYRYF